MEDNPYQAPAISESPAMEASTLTEAEIRAFVGRRAGYYLTKWAAALDDPFGRATGFNWAAFLFSGLWIPYRKMYRTALIFYSIVVAVSVVEFIAQAAGFLSDGALRALEGFDRIIGLVFSIVCGMYGNYWYLTHARREIARIRASGLKDAAYYDALARRGGTTILASLGLFFLFIVVLVLVVVLPSLFLEGADF
jgi:hypothetical protein